MKSVGDLTMSIRGYAEPCLCGAIDCPDCGNPEAVALEHECDLLVEWICDEVTPKITEYEQLREIRWEIARIVELKIST